VGSPLPAQTTGNLICVAPALAEVARAAGVSVKTASRVLNNSSELRPATAARVRAAMMKLNYQPNELARGLKAKRSTAIAMIAPNLADPLIASAVRAVQDVARERGYAVILAGSVGLSSSLRERSLRS
jgi:LacI family transcriptional regulator